MVSLLGRYPNTIMMIFGCGSLASVALLMGSIPSERWWLVGVIVLCVVLSWWCERCVDQQRQRRLKEVLRR